MGKDRKILAIITARGGSKGLPGKNIRMFAGKPLITHTIERTLAVGPLIYKVLVSTDDQEICDIAEQAGAYVPFLRPPELATDTASSLNVVQHALRFVEGERDVSIDWTLILQPTTPLRTVDDILSAIRLTDSKEVDTIVSVYESGHSHPLKAKKIDKYGFLMPFFSEASWLSRRQDLSPPAYLTNGGIYLTRRDVLLENNSLIGDQVLPYVMPQERSVDIDNRIDFMLAELLMREQLGIHPAFE